MTDLSTYGFERREQQLKAARKAENHQVIQLAQQICTSEWQIFLQKLQETAEENVEYMIDEQQLNQLYEQIFKLFREQVKPSCMSVALAQRLKFFNHINKLRKNAQLEPLPLPIIATQVKRPSNTNDLANFLYLEKAEKIVQQAIDTWQQKNHFSHLDSVTWLLFSLFTFSGYNEEQVVYAIYQALKEQQPIYEMSNHQLVMPVNISSTLYANHVLRVDKDNPDDVQLSYTRWVFFDDVSRLWLAYLHRNYPEVKKFPSFTDCIRRLSNFVNEKFNADSFKHADFLKYINIYWQTLPNVHIDQQLVQTLVGRQPHTAITQDQLLRYFNPIKQLETTISLAEGLIASQTESEKISDNLAQSIFYKDDMIKTIRAILNEDKKTILTELVHLLILPNISPNQHRIIQWQIDLLKKGNKISTVRRYLSEIGNDFLAETRDTNFEGWQDFEYKYVYDKIISSKNPLKMGYTQTVIASLHEVLVSDFKAPYLKINRDKDPLIVDSCIIPYKLYYYILDQLNEQPMLSAELKQVLRLIITLLYRTGMRFNEVLSLRIHDIEYDNQMFLDYGIVLRPHEQRALKSDDATRRFMLKYLLSPDELAQFKHYFHLKKQQNARFLFTLPNQAQSIDRNSVELPIRQILGDRYRDITMHSFRHNAISNMAIILRCDYSIIEQFTDYSEKQALAIQQHALGKNRNTNANYWNVLQDFAGHADLNTTFSSYIHTADIIAHQQLSKATIRLPIATVMKLSGKARRSFNQHHAEAVNFSEGVVNLSLIRSLINKVIGVQKLTHESTAKQSLPNNQSSEKVHSIEENLASIFAKYDRKVIEKMLNDVELGIDLSTASQLNFDFNDAYIIYQKAVKLVRNEDGTPNYKLISQKRKSKSEHPLIAPTPLHYHQEIALANLCFDNLDKINVSKAGQKEITNFANTFYEKIIVTKSEIRFPFKDKKQFYAFLETGLKILPSEYWRVNICKYTPTTIIHEQTGDKSFLANIDKPLTQHFLTLFRQRFDTFNGEMTTNAYYSGFSVSIIRPNQKGKTTKDQPNSALMKYVVHWLLIVECLKDR